ncbi:TPA: hypothetical protein ACGW5B_005514 [Bacillus paranthracis]|uniref:hypothetical protein n=1 Tax=Bacillus sp. FSL W8-0519 TaxID=2954624 RepID=UPI0002E2FEF4
MEDERISKDVAAVDDYDYFFELYEEEQRRNAFPEWIRERGLENELWVRLRWGK